MFKVEDIKKDFPILSRKINDAPLVYLDNAATSQKPDQVIDTISDFYKHHNANVHRGVHTLSEESTKMYEEARKMVADFIGAASAEEIIFTSGTTDSLNTVAFGWGLANLGHGDKVLVVESEHHSALVPWQVVCKMAGAELVSVGVNSDGELDLKEIEDKLSGTKIISLSHASNVLGTVFPIKEISRLAKKAGALVCVDGAQAAPHFPVNIQSLGCDFYSFSGHKMLAPTGIGVLWIRKELQDKMNPFKFGGGMINEVSIQESTWATGPEKFEAGTPNVEGVIGLGAAINYLNRLGMENVRAHDLELTKYTLEALAKVPGLTILGPKNPENRTSLVSFTISGMHPHDIATILNNDGIAVRSGHHCAMPLHKKLAISASTRASFYIYNSTDDIDALVKGLERAHERLL